MAFDAVSLRASIGEMEELVGSRLQKIYETTDRDEILLHLYDGQRTRVLLISSNRQHARMHLTRRKYTHPRRPSNFCMMLRKHLTPGSLQALVQIDMDRLAELTINTYDDLGRTREFTLVAETMGRFSNLLLLDEDRKILTAHRFISADRNAHRTILPGHPYRRPPAQDGIALDQVSAATLQQRVDDESSDAPPAWLWLVRNVQGPGPAEARRLLSGIGLRPKDPLPANGEDLRRLAERLQECSEVIEKGKWHPYYTTRKTDSPGLPEPVTLGMLPPPPNPTGDGTRVRSFPTPSHCLDAFYALREEWDAYDQLRRELLKTLRDARKHIERRIDKQERELPGPEEAESARRRGEILTTYMHQVPDRASEVELANYYENGAPITISLDPRQSPADNAAAYFDQYRKLQRTRRIAKRKIQGSHEELNYARTLLDAAERSETRGELEEIYREARRAGYVKRPQRSRRGQKRDGSKPKPYRKYVTPSGAAIYVGRHNRGNDYLITRVAGPDDLWLHVKDMPGSHVLLRGPWSEKRTPNDRTLEEAAILAAYHSSARHSSNVPVDYTLVKHVNKPRGSKPGMVTYTNQQTLFVTPPRHLAGYRQRSE